jgi:uncharacterized protein (UPF0276 family)
MKKLTGAGLGLRREMSAELSNGLPKDVDFWEVAPENWIPFGGQYAEQFREYTNNATFVSHGLSLSIGSPEKLDINFVKQVKSFLDQYGILFYSEHLSYCSGKGHMYDLMPIPFTKGAIDHVVDRIKVVQDILERPLVLENVSYYAAPGQEMSELEFTLEILERSGCLMLLDVNNIYVNSVNHGYDASEFLQAIPSNKIVYGHIAGHYNEADDLIVDTHGADVIEDVWAILDKAYEIHGVFPTLLERDFNIPSIETLLLEVNRIKSYQNKEYQGKHKQSQQMRA